MSSTATERVQTPELRRGQSSQSAAIRFAPGTIEIYRCPGIATRLVNWLRSL